MKTVDITYRYGAQSTATRPRPLNSNAAHIRLNDGNQAFAALLEGMTDADGNVQKIVFVDPSDLGLLAGDPALPKTTSVRRHSWLLRRSRADRIDLQRRAE